MIYKMFAYTSAWAGEERYNFNYFLHVRGLLMATSTQLGLHFFGLVWFGFSYPLRFLMEVNFSGQKKMHKDLLHLTSFC